MLMIEGIDRSASACPKWGKDYTHKLKHENREGPTT